MLWIISILYPTAGECSIRGKKTKPSSTTVVRILVFSQLIKAIHALILLLCTGTCFPVTRVEVIHLSHTLKILFFFCFFFLLQKHFRQCSTFKQKFHQKTPNSFILFAQILWALRHKLQFKSVNQKFLIMTKSTELFSTLLQLSLRDEKKNKQKKTPPKRFYM